jgi:hypothetical protein
MAQSKTGKPEGKRKLSFDFAYYGKLILIVLVAFAGTYYALPQRGLISTLPVYLIAALLAVFIKIPVWQKAALFGIFAFTFSTVYYKPLYTAIFAGICVLTVFICSFAYHLFKKKRTPSAIVAILLVCACIIPHSLLFGNIFDGMTADKMIREYVSEHYTSDEFVISDTSYDFNTGLYKATVYNVKLPTEKYSLSVYNSRLTDSYLRFAEIKLMEKRAIEIRAALREKFPNEMFSVTPLGISGYPYKDQISLNDTDNYNEYMRFEIHVPGYLFKNEFAMKAKSYYNTLVNAKLAFREIVFIGSGEYLNALSIKVPYDLLPKDMEKLIKPSNLLPLSSNYIFE